MEGTRKGYRYRGGIGDMSADVPSPVSRTAVSLPFDLTTHDIDPLTSCAA